MNERGKNILPVIGFIILVSLLLGGFSIGKYQENIRKSSNSTVAKPESSNLTEQTGKASTQGVYKIAINAVSSEISISSHDSDEVEARFYIESKALNSNEFPRLEVGNDGSTAYVRIKYPEGLKISVPGQTRLDVLIPDKWSKDLEIGSVSGSITASYLTGDNVRLNTTSGLIDAGKVEGNNIYLTSTSGQYKIGEIKAENKFQKNTVSGKCEIDELICNEAGLDSTSGETIIKAIKSEKVKSSSISGSFEASVEKGAVEIRTTSADIKVRFPGSFESFKANSVSGDVRLKIPEDSEFEVYIKTISGDIDCRDFPMRVISSKQNELKGTVGDAKSRIEISTTSGSVEVKKE